MEVSETAMTQLRDKLLFEVQNLKEIDTGNEYLRGYREALKNIANDIDCQMIMFEREQILNAFVAGDERGTKEIPFNCEQYYTQTYTSEPV